MILCNIVKLLLPLDKLQSLIPFRNARKSQSFWHQPRLDLHLFKRAFLLKMKNKSDLMIVIYVNSRQHFILECAPHIYAHSTTMPNVWYESVFNCVFLRKQTPQLLIIIYMVRRRFIQENEKTIQLIDALFLVMKCDALKEIGVGTH